MRAHSQPRRGQDLAQRMAEAIDPRWRPVAAPLEPRDPRTLYDPAWAIVAGEEGARHVVAVVSTWRVTLEGPTYAATRTRTIGAVDEEDAAARDLAEAAARWLTDEPEAPGITDVALHVFFRVATAFADDLWRIGLLANEGWVSLHRGGVDWPVYVAIVRRPDRARIVAGDVEVAITSIAAADDPRIVPAVQRLIARSERLVAARDRAREFVAALCEGATPPDEGAWRIDGAGPPLNLAAPPAAGITFVAAGGREVTIGAVYVDDDDRGTLTVRRASIALRDLDEARGAAAWLTDAARRLYHSVCPETLEIGRRYRLLRPLQGAPAGAILEYRGILETRPRGDVYDFRSSTSSVALALDDEVDRRVIDALEDHFGPVSRARE
ncbi:MAG: hypothetical protein R3B09_12835 [Nannocystaceae bacterium]